jgi:hypothetical protein
MSFCCARLAIILSAAIGQAGCPALNDSFSDDIDRTYNPWLGQTKGARIQIVGPPQRCQRLQSKEEVCAWDRMSLDMPAVRRMLLMNIPSWKHHVVYVYDQSGIARAWHYSGTWGERSSGDKPSADSPDQSALLP